MNLQRWLSLENIQEDTLRDSFSYELCVDIGFFGGLSGLSQCKSWHQEWWDM